VSDPRLSNYVFFTSYSSYNGTARLAGPFYRKRSPTQRLEDDQKLIDSGMLWGQTPRNGKCPTAQAYFGSLPAQEHGVEFFTSTQPHQTGLPDHFGANWYLDDTAFTGRISDGGKTYAAITIVVVKHAP
jgi:hypothetical protein